MTPLFLLKTPQFFYGFQDTKMKIFRSFIPLLNTSEKYTKRFCSGNKNINCALYRDWIWFSPLSAPTELIRQYYEAILRWRRFRLVMDRNRFFAPFRFQSVIHTWISCLHFYLRLIILPQLCTTHALNPHDLFTRVLFVNAGNYLNILEKKEKEKKCRILWC